MNIKNSECHLIMADGSVVNYISHVDKLNCFIEQLIVVCNYTSGLGEALLYGQQFTVHIDVKTDLKEYCLANPEYITHSMLFAMSYSKDYSIATLLIDTTRFTDKHQKLADITLSMIGTIKYVMLVATGSWSPAHCALVEIAGKGALICAPGGTGKSTCATRLPISHRALAEDCALVVEFGDSFMAQAMPAWSLVTSEHKKIADVCFDCTASTKLSGIFFLEQGEYDTVEPINLPTAVGYLNSSFKDHLHGALQRLPILEVKMLRLNTFYLAEKVIKTLPAYRLSATIDGNFWDVMAGVL